MTIDRLFDFFQLGALACLAFLGIGRGIALYARGIRVVVIERERSAAQALADLLFSVCFLLWFYEVIAYAWPLETHLVPAAFGGVLVDALPLKIAGGMVMSAGLVIFALALRAFGTSWRLGIDREAPGVLVTHGIFGWSRNPIYLGLDLLMVGSFLIQGRLVFLAIALLAPLLLHGLIRREERFLGSAYGDAYREYCARVPRYFGWAPSMSGGFSSSWDGS